MAGSKKRAGAKRPGKSAEKAPKVAARGALIESELDPDRVIVRVNPPGTDAFVADLATLSQTDYRTVMVAKAESVKQLRDIDGRHAFRHDEYG